MKLSTVRGLLLLFSRFLFHIQSFSFASPIKTWLTELLWGDHSVIHLLQGAGPLTCTNPSELGLKTQVKRKHTKAILDNY